MSFFLLQRKTSSNSLQMLGSKSYDSMQDARDALAGYVTHDSLGDDYFICDLANASPVVFIALAPETDTLEESVSSEAGVWEAPVVEPEPESVSESVDSSAAEDDVPDAVFEVSDIPEAEFKESDIADEIPPELTEESGLAAALRRATGSMEAEGIVTPESVTATPAADEPADIGEITEESEAVEEEAPADWPWSDDAPEASDDSESEAASGSEVEAPSEDAAEAPSEAVVDSSGMGAYEAADVVELSDYTCDDCVYNNTCPKAGDSDPEHCGSFQWRVAE